MFKLVVKKCVPKLAKLKLKLKTVTVYTCLTFAAAAICSSVDFEVGYTS